MLVTDGSNLIYQMNPLNLEIEKTTKVFYMKGDIKKTINYLNDMEMIDGYLYIHVFTQPLMLKVHPQSGLILKTIDMSLVIQEIKNTKYFRNNFNDI